MKRAVEVINCFVYNQYKGEHNMAFLKATDKKGVEAIINTDMICRIAKTKNGYIVFFSSGNTGSAYYEYTFQEIQKIFQVIGVSLD